MDKNEGNVPKIRFPGFEGPWEQRKLGDITDRIVRKNTDNESTLPLTISAQYGLVDQISFFNKRVASRDVSNYYLIKKGEFAYNKSYSDGYPYGAIKRLERYDMGVLSTLYIVFCIKEIINSDYLISYYDSNKWHNEVGKRAAEGARNHGLLNISADDFFSTELKFPKELEEQKKIGEYFIKIENLIKLHQRKLEHLQDKKKGLLQKMFPKEGEKFPEIRFPGFTDPWKQCKIVDVIDGLYNGQTPSRFSDDFWNGNINWLSSGELNRSVVTTTSEKITVAGQKDANLRIVPKNTFVMAITGLEAAGTRGNCGILGIDTTLNQSCMAIFPNKKLLNTQFLFQWYKMVGEDYGIRFTQGTKQQSYNAEIIRNLDICLPKAEEQLKIGELFSELDNLITLHKRKLEHIQQQKKGLLQQMFI